MKHLIAFLILALGIQAGAADKIVKVDAQLEYFSCLKEGPTVTCTGTGKKVAPNQSASLVLTDSSSKNEKGVKQFIFEIAGESKVGLQVAIGESKSKGGRIFTSTAFGAGDYSTQEVIFDGGSSILELNPNDPIRSIQLYSPHFTMDGKLQQIKATIKFEQSGPQNQSATEDQLLLDGGHYKLMQSDLKKFIEFKIKNSAVLDLSVRRSWNLGRIVLIWNALDFVRVVDFQLKKNNTTYTISCDLGVGGPYKALSMKNCVSSPRTQIDDMFALLTDFLKVDRIETR